MATSAVSSNPPRTVRCPNCGYVTHLVSGFCPRCLSRLPAPPIGLSPRVIFGMVGLVALGLTLVADAAILAQDSRSPSVELKPSASAQAQLTSSPAQQILPSTNRGAPDNTAASPIVTTPNTLPDTATPTSGSASRPLRTGRDRAESAQPRRLRYRE